MYGYTESYTHTLILKHFIIIIVIILARTMKHLAEAFTF